MRTIDTHQHFWNLDEVAYPWLTSELSPIYRNFSPEELAPQLSAAGVDKTVIVQSMNSYADTDSMLAIADAYDWVAGVVGWLPLHDPAETARRSWRNTRRIIISRGCGISFMTSRIQIGCAQKQVIESLRMLADRGMTFDVVAVFPNHLKHVPTPGGERAQSEDGDRSFGEAAAWQTPSARSGASNWQPAAESPNVYAKLSGLNTVTADFENWTYEDIKPLIDFAIETFGAERLMFGSDWPVAILAGDYAKVWDETNKCLADLSAEERGAILGGTGSAFYNLSR